MGDLIFIRPWFLLALLPVIAVAIGLLRRQKEGTAWLGLIDTHLLSHLLVGEGKNQKIRPTHVLCVIWVLSAIALSGPSWR